MRHIVIIGSNGQLGTDLQPALRDFRVTPLTHAQIDVSDFAKARATLTPLKPDAVINTSAYHKVDVCEDEPGLSFAVNANGPYNLARLAAELDFTLVHFSTDYVFDGLGTKPYAEDALPNPVNVYGVSKLAGERLACNFCPRHYVLRTTGLYGVAGASGKGGNFVETMIRLGKSGNPVKVVHDQVLTPTATADLSNAVTELLTREPGKRAPYGLYQVTSQGECSWYEFARTIYELSGMKVDLSPITTAESGSIARRPAYSVLGHRRWVDAGMTELRPWRAALGDYLRAKGHIAGH